MFKNLHKGAGDESLGVTGYSCRIFRFNPQHPHHGPQPFVTPVLMPPSNPRVPVMHTATQAYMHIKHSYREHLEKQKFKHTHTHKIPAFRIVISKCAALTRLPQ